ncbi:MAG TPA: Gfo/Idh/MocA family oxidoreductase [Prolixibacteraceae bacterium]|nr:Gfo/Idh/MocA family oxidoreductase [Prolixibacteraceae bacterium]
MNRIKVGVAGLGFIGPAHIEALRRIPGIEVVAVSETSEELAKEKARQMGIAKYHGRFEDLLKEDIDCVHICTPNNLHFKMAKAALLAGKHVVCEKPLATTVDEGKELLELAKKKGLVHAVHFNIRYYPMVRQMKVMREKGELGEIYSIIGSYLQDWLFYTTDYNWRLEPELSGKSKAVADIGSHLMDLLEYISGVKITEVMADFNTIHPVRKKPLKPVETFTGKMLKPEDYKDVPISTEDYATVLLRFDNGNKGVITVSQVNAGRKNRLSLEISGSKQTFNWCSERPNEMWFGKRNEPNQVLMRDPSLFEKESAELISFPGGHNEGFPDTSKQMFKEVYHNIGKTTMKGATFPTFEAGLRELILCERILESNEKQQWVKV